MSALPPKADIGTQPRNVRFVSNAATANNTRRNQTPDAAETAVLAAVGVKPEEFSDTLASCEFFDGTSL